MSFGCGDCSKRKECDTVCEKMEEALEGLDLAASREPLAFVETPPEYAIPHDDGSCHVETVHEGTQRAIGGGIEMLCRIRKRDAMMFFGRVYLGMSVEELGKYFNIKRSVVYGCLKRAKGDLERVQVD